tara:strand:+ start:1032 stop:1235 length:204 start_codon:yes stop_codon:yes gene_type:complete
MTRLVAIMAFSAFILSACTQEGRENLVRDWCESADNCSVYDENGREHANATCVTATPIAAITETGAI